MKLFFTERFHRDYKGLPGAIQSQTDHKLELFIKNARHPSLQAKKMQRTHGIWELRVNQSYRMTFEMNEDTCVLRRIGTHDVLRKP